MHTASRLLAPSRAFSRLLAPSRAFSRLLLLTLFALGALLHTARPAQADDTTPPTVTNAKITPTGTYTAGATLPTITITATVTDNAGGSGVENVYAQTSLNGDLTSQYTLLTKGSGNTYTGTLDLSYFGSNTGTTSNVYTVYIEAVDNNGNQADVYASGSVTQSADTTPPAITNAKFTPTGTYSAGATLPTITMTATVTDTGGSGVSSVYGYIYRNGEYNQGVQLTKGSGNTYSGTFDLSTFRTNTDTTNRVYTVDIYAYDNAGNQATVTATGSVTQTAPPAPKLSGASVTPNIIPNGGATVTLKVSATPGVFRNISTVRAEVYEDGTDLGYSDLTSTGGTGYSITRDIPAGDSAPHLYSFVFIAYDDYGVSSSTVTRYAQQAGTNSLPAPTLTSISPSTAFVNTGVTLTLTGTNFTPSSVVLFDGFVVPATYVSATSLTCAVDKSFLPSVKQASVKVYNPKPAGGTSAAQTFTIKPRLVSILLAPASVPGGQGSAASLTLAADAYTVTFMVSTADVAASTPVTIKATLGPGSVSGTLTVTPATPPVMLSGVSFAPTSVVGGSANTTGTVTLSAPAPAGGAVVSLSSSSSALTFSASTVTVPEGATSATFRAYSHKVTGTVNVTVTAIYSGTSKTATVVVTPATVAAALSGVSFNPATVKGGSANTTGTVTLTGPAPSGGAVVSVSSNSSALTLNVTSVTVAAGATTATFRAYSHAVTSTKTATVTATVTATYSGASKTAAVTVTP